MGNNDLILLTETCLSSGFHDNAIFDQRYNVVRKDRSINDKRGGGVLIVLLKNIDFEIIEVRCNIE